jgi:hypothetical protein
VSRAGAFDSSDRHLAKLLASASKALEAAELSSQSALDANKRYKRARLTIQTLDNQSLDAPLDRFFYSIYVRFTGAKVHILTQPRLQHIPPQRLLTDRPVAGLAHARHEPRLGGAGPGVLLCLQQRPNAHHQQRVLLIYAMLDGTKISNLRY